MLQRIAKYQISGPIYSADQIIGKTLIARRPVKLYRYPSATAATVYTVQPGQSVGKVYSWTGGGAAPLYWMFYDQNGKTYYALHQEGAFDIEALQDQGALTVEEVREQENPTPASQQFIELGKKLLTFGAIAAVVIYAIRQSK